MITTVSLVNIHRHTKLDKIFVYLFYCKKEATAETGFSKKRFLFHVTRRPEVKRALGSA